jgi:ankyrin repeat protein
MNRFLLLHLDLDSLKGTTSVAEVKSALERFSNRKHGERGQDGLQTALEQAYDEAMDRIDRQSPDQQRLARNALEWITCAKRPLSPLELQHALAVNPGGTAFDPENLREVDSIISLCAGLVTIDEESNVVRLVHYTTQKFFDRRQSQLFPGAETKLAVFCCQYLSNIAQSGNDYPYNSYSETLQLNPLYFYAGENWGHHARLMPEIPRSIQDFMTCQTTIQAAERALNLLRHPLITNLLRYPLTTNHLRFSLRSRSDIFPLRWNGLHLAAFFGICQALDFLSNNQHDLDLPDTANNTPLIYAVQSQHQEMARLLLQKGVTVNTLPSFGGPALDHAIANHDESMVSLLLENGADVNQEIYGTLPLLRAIRLSNASHLSDGITRLLIEKGAKITFSKEDRPLYEAAVCGHESLLELLWKEDDISTRLLDLVEHLDEESAFGKLGFFGSQFYEGQARVVNVLLGRFLTESEPILRQRLLFLAARHGCMDSLQLLLQQGVAVQSRGWQSRTTLSYAALGGNAAPVRFLLEEGSEIDAKDVFGRTPLSLAAGSSEDCRAAIEILLDEGAEIETRDDSGSTPLLRACAARKYKHQYGTIKMLLDRGAAVEAKDQTGSTPLMQACEGDRTSDDRYELIELLLDRGAATEARDKNGRTALMKAAHVSYARLLLDKGALIEATDDLGTTALMHAAWRLRLDVAKELLSRGAAVHARSKNGMTAISSVKPALSCRTMSPLNAFSIFKSLIDNGACVDERDIYGSTVLMGVARKGSASSIRFLLDQGADIKARDQSGLTALMHAAQVGNDYTVGELLDSGAAIEARDGWGQTPLMHAIGSLECMRKLLNRGAAIEARDGQGRTPLSSASYRGYLDCMKMLLDRGAKLDARDNDGKTALIYAVNGWREPSAAVATLLERGAALKARDNQGRTALSYAIMRREKRLIVQLLRANRKGRV